MSTKAASAIRFPQAVDGCDRASAMWQRMRAAVGSTHAAYLDVDAHIDQVAQLVERVTAPPVPHDPRRASS